MKSLNIKELHSIAFLNLHVFVKNIENFHKTHKIDIRHFNPVNDREAWSEIDFAFKQEAFEEALNDFHHALNSKKIVMLNDCIEKLESLDYFDSSEIDDFFDEAKESAETLRIDEGSLIKEFNPSIIQAPALIQSINGALLGVLAKNPEWIFSISPRQFEEIIAEIFFRQGFTVDLTKSTRDGGKDIIAFYNHMDIPTKYIIECKRYSKQRKVSIALVQRLLGVKIANSANKAILVTTSSFTNDAISFSKNHLWDIELKDYNDIVSWLKIDQKD